MRRPFWILAAVLLLAFALRVHALEGQSMWSDEGLSVYRARQSLAAIAANTITVDGVATQDTNPPFYFYLLHGLRAAAGESVFVLRYLGVLAGTLSVPLLYRLGRTLFGRRAGLLAGLLLAISPFHVWQSQEMRNYPLLLLLNLASVYGLARFLNGRVGRRPWLLLWLAAGLLGIYTHYFGFFVFAFGLAALLVLGRRWPGWLWPALAAAGLLAAPVVLVALARFRAGQQVDFVTVPLADLLSHAASVYAVGIRPGIVHPAWRVAPALLLPGLGAAFTWRRRPFDFPQTLRTGRPALFTLGYLVIPLAILVALSTINPLYNGPRHLLIGLPPFLLLVAAGVALAPTRWRWLSWGTAVLLIISQTSWLQTQFTAPELVKDDVRGAAVALSDAVRPGDVVVLHDTLIAPTFNYYYDGPAPVTSVPPFWELDPARAETMLAETAAADRLWFLTDPRPRTGFPRDHLRDWAADAWPRFYDRRFSSLWLGVALEGYVPQPAVEALPADAASLDVIWPDGLALRGLWSERTAVSGADWWPEFYWTRHGLIGDDLSSPSTGSGHGSGRHSGQALRLSLRLLDAEGRQWAQIDRPLWPDYPPSAWPEGALIQQPARAPLPVGLPPGDYAVWLRLINAENGRPLPTADGRVDGLILPALRVQSNPAATVADLPPNTPLQARWGAVELVGYRLPDVAYRPGHVLPVDLFWQARGGAERPFQVVIQLLDESGRLAAEAIAPPTRSDYPPTEWVAGELIHGRLELVVPPRAETGSYSVRMALRDPATGGWLPGRRPWRLFNQQTVELGEAAVEAWPLETELPPIPMPLAATLGDPPLAALAGYGLTERTAVPGETLELTLFWRALRDGSENYRVFVHLTDATGEIVAQADGLPVGGARPTPGWRAGEALVDVHRIAVGLDVTPGAYQLWAGLYDPETGQRPRTVLDGAVQDDGRLPLGDVTVTP